MTAPRIFIVSASPTSLALLAGDAAHAFSPATGQGLNTGMQDAVNLDWKLACATRAAAPEAWLASFWSRIPARDPSVMASTCVASCIPGTMDIT